MVKNEFLLGQNSLQTCLQSQKGVCYWHKNGCPWSKTKRPKLISNH